MFILSLFQNNSLQSLRCSVICLLLSICLAENGINNREQSEEIGNACSTVCNGIIASELRRMRNDIAYLKENNVKLSEEVTELKAEIREYKRRENVTGNVEHSYRRYQLPNEPQVAFSAALSVLSLNVSVGTHVVFDQVETNVGQAYNASNGIFTCPNSGYYYFTHAALASFVGGWLETEILLEGVPKALIYCGDRRSFQNLTDYDQGANSVIVQCAQGQRVWVQIYNNNGSVLFNERYTQFSGYLLWTV